jgi:D-glycero-D-manno-heptose 1,7-bisphosphate phosphatase
VREGLAKLKAAGLCLVVLTNQSGVARGYFGEDDVRAFHAELNQQLGPTAAIDAFYYCPFHPDAVEPRYRSDSRLRKPEVGMYELACSEHPIDRARSYIIGDRWLDMELGRRAGLRACLVPSPQHEAEADRTTTPAFLTRPDFASAVSTILDCHAGKRDAWQR